jgi:hypothetical protein
MGAVPVDELSESKEAFVRFMNYKQLPYSKGEYYVLSFKPRMTKAGSRMATMTVANADRELRSVVVWPNTFAMAYTRIDEGNAYKMTFGKTKEGDLTLKTVDRKEEQ